MKRVGFIGVGIMGSSMVRNLMKDGHEVHIYARNKEKVEQVIADGAVFHDTIAECVKGRDAVITIVGYPQDVEDVYLGEDKILESADPGTYLIDMTTTSPSLDAQLAKEAAEKGLKMLDAPVTGGDYGARSGTLSILVGGAKGLVCVWLAGIVLTFFQCRGAFAELFSAMERTLFAGYFYENNILLQLILTIFT